MKDNKTSEGTGISEMYLDNLTDSPILTKTEISYINIDL